MNSDNLTVHWNKVTLVGVGLLGGSLGVALKQLGSANEVCGYVRRRVSIGQCERAGAVDWATTDLAKAVAGAELLVFCTPVSQMEPLAQRMVPEVRRGALVTDVGSVKGSLVRSLETTFRRAKVHFIGSHPMAGSEKTGVLAARGDLFKGSVCVVTPTSRSHADALSKVRALWRAVGAQVLTLSPQAHDLLVSRSSHLPHVLAAQLANLVLNPRSPAEQRRVCANGFRDCTRIASGSPEMWRDIALANAPQIAKSLSQFIGGLRRFQTALDRRDSRWLANFFEQAKQRRDAWSQPRALSSE